MTAESITPGASRVGAMTEWIGETFTSSAGWDHLEELVDIGNRMAGSPGEREAAEATRDALDAAGARDAHIETFDIQGWERATSEIRAAGTTHGVHSECIALPRSPAGEVTGEFVDLGYGLPEDFETDLSGAVVMAASDVPEWYDRFIHRREKYYRAVEAGAAGFVFRNHVEGCLAPTGSVGTEEAPIGDIPAVGVSKELGERIARRHEGGEVTVAVEADTPDATSGNVHADLGPDTDEVVLVTSHVDAHDIAEGAGDNGAGTALVVELANALAAREAELETCVHITVFGAEEVGLRGSEHDAANRDPDSITAVVNNDGVVRGRTLRCYTHGFDDLDDAASTVAERLDHPIETTPEQGPHSDHWPYVVGGIPGYHVLSKTGGRGRGWGHTRADTLDKLDPRNLREQAVVLTELVVHLARGDTAIDHRDPGDIAAALEDEDLAEGMQVIGDWPFEG
jgi:Zn-dependent M28 family amino/carboxypeptidase